MSQKQTKKLRFTARVLFVIYLLVLVYFLCFFERFGNGECQNCYRYNLVLFKEIRRFIEHSQELGITAVFTNLAGNVLIFVPFGFFISAASRRMRLKKAVGFSLLLSFMVELLQLVLRVGIFDVDDMLLNTLGGLSGFILFWICNNLRRLLYEHR